MCGECRPSSSAARRCACIPKTLDMPLKITDKTDKSPSRRHGSSSKHASDVLTKPTEGLRWFLPSLGGPRGPREQPRIHTEFVAMSGPVFGPPAQAGRLRGARRWAVGQRTPPGRTCLRCRRPVGPGWPFCAFGAKGRGVVGAAAGPDASWGDESNGHNGPAFPVCRQAGDMEVRREHRT
jgi:hypothetical protein